MADLSQFAEATAAVKHSPHAVSAWEEAEGLAADLDKPDDIVTLFNETLADKLEPEVAEMIGERAGAFCDEWFGDDPKVLEKILSRVLVLAPNHTGRGARGSVWPGGAWRVPGADVPVDAAFCRALCEESTLLEPDEILSEIRIPIPPAGTGWSYQKLKRKTGDFATAATAVLLQMNGARVAKASIALTNAAATALKASAAESSLIGKAIDNASLNEAARLAMGICEPTADQRGDVEYKVAMCGEMTRRALQAAYARTSKP